MSKSTNASLGPHVLSEASLVFRVEDQKIKIQPQKFLQFCWTGGLDTPCSICNAPFIEAPPVRLLGLTEAVYDTCPATGTLTILNSHLTCLQRRGVRFLPVSRAWHHPVAEAYSSRMSNPSAAAIVYDMPLRTLIAAVQRFGPDVQIWHDYISIPQWQDDFRGTTILPQIFQIFEQGHSSIVHLDIQPPIQILENFTLEILITQSLSLLRLFSARWFGRMWPVVEYDLSPTAFLMDSNYEIMSQTFSSLVKQIIDGYSRSANGNNTPRDIKLPAESTLQWSEDIPLFLKDNSKKRCLGHIYDMIAEQGCRSYRDRFIASCALLRIQDYCSKLPADAQDACLWVSEECFARNDFSPLLLAPSDEPCFSKSIWLKGHSSMTSQMWGLGVQTCAARERPQVHEHQVNLKVDFLGMVLRSESWEQGEEDCHFGFDNVLPRLVEYAGKSASRFLEFLQGLYPLPFFWDERDGKYHFLAMSYEDLRIGNVETELQHLLDDFGEVNRREYPLQCRRLSSKLVSLLGLSVPPMTNVATFGSLGRLQLYGRECSSSEYTLLWVKCPACGIEMLFRATMWQKPKSEAHVYRIPGLAYQKSLPEGMGIVVENEKIIGRLRFAYRLCSCNVLATVNLP
jgi:hypothetical protein